MFFRVFETSLGWAGIAGTDLGITLLQLPKRGRAESFNAITQLAGVDSIESTSHFGETVEAITSYFDGNRVDFKCEVDSVRAGAFDIRVWNAAREVQYGEVVSYSWIAGRIGNPNAQRAVGQALGRNPVPLIVPCHRVLRADGRMGGFACGLDWKLKLLDLERRTRH